jgi:two-component system, NtrC family, response regulator AtoC
VTATILYADPDPKAAKLAAEALTQAAHRVRLASDSAALEREAADGAVDVLVVDVGLLGSSTEEWLANAAQRWPDMPVVIVSKDATEGDSIEALRSGAAGFVSKPFVSEELMLAIQNGVSSAEHSANVPPPASVRHPAIKEPPRTAMIGDSPAMREINSLIRRAATTQATVLVRGESGSGKEVIVRRIHELSSRSDGPFVKVHCAALPEQLLESELFGHEKGAFTGANARKPGRFEVAEGGTLFLDEIGDVSLAIQVKLLRVLQDKEYERIGSTRTIRANVRFIAATHRPLEAMIKRGEFREDLYYRLNVISVTSPPLRNRPDDIEQLVHYFCTALGAQNGKPRLKFAPDAIQLLRLQPWPGNVRQLQNFVERLVVFAESDEVDVAAVWGELGVGVGNSASSTGTTALDFSISVLELDEVVRRAERKALEKALHKAGGNRTVAARILGVSRRTLYNKLEEHHLL